MRLKGISWAEQHFEKVFAGVFAVGALGVLTWQYVGGQSTVNVGKDTVPIEQAYDPVVQEARRVAGLIGRSPESLPTLDKNPIAEFDKAYRGPVVPSPRLAVAIGASGVLPTAPGVAPSQLAPIAELQVPAASRPVAYAYMQTVHPVEIAQDPAVAGVLTQSAPFDEAFVTVEATFDGRALRAALERDPDGLGPTRAIPRNWWDAMQLLAVNIERQELTADGQWGNATTIPAMPGRFSLRPRIEAGVSGADELRTLREAATVAADQVRRPQPYAILMGEDWLPPTERVASDAEAHAGGPDMIAGTRRRIEQVARQKKQKEDLLATLPPYTQPDDQGREGDRTPPPPGGRDGGGGGGGKGAGGRGPGGRNPGPGSGPSAAQPSPQNDARRRQLERAIEQDQEQINRLKRSIGEPVDGEAAAAAPVQPSEVQKLEPPLLDTQSVRLWAHDYTVERGKAYRYRMTLVFDNPMFGRGAVMIPEQVEWTRSTLVNSTPSDWSDAVRTDDQTYYFITSASEAGGPLNRAADARAELFVFTLGYWRRGGATLEPGDRVAAEIQVPDYAKLPPEVLNPIVDPAAPPPGAEPPGRAGGKGPAAAPPAPAPGAPPAGATPTALPMTTQAFAAEAVLLGISQAPLPIETDDGAPRMTTQAVLREQPGEIVVKIPDNEKSSDTFVRVSRSADQARLAATPRVPERQPNFPGRDRDLPPPPPGGGGGGGSGG